MREPIVLDLETKYTFRKYKDPKKLQISVAGIYDYKTNQSLTFLEDELPKLYKYLENSSYIVGYNIDSFDLPVLSAYYPGDTSQFKTFDLLVDIRNKIGRRLGLDDLIKATLMKKKTGHGLQAVEFYKEGRIDELCQYCIDDVLLTKELFEYGAKKRQVYYMNETGKVTIKVDWQKYLERTSSASDISLTLPF